MNILNRKLLCKTALATLLLTSISNASSAYENSHYSDEKEGNFYMGLNLGKVIPNIVPFSAKEDVESVTTEKIFSLDSNDNAKEGYDPKYTGDFLGSVSIGYKIGNFGIELEDLVSSVTTKDWYVELYRNLPDNKTGVTDYHIKNKDGKFESATSPNIHEWESIIDDGAGGNGRRQLHSAFKMKNEGFRNIAAMINAYYYLNNESNITPYAGIGAGLTNIKFLGVSHFKPAYQGKVGVRYNINDTTKISAGYRYFGVLGSTFTKVDPTAKIPDIYYGSSYNEKIGYAGSTTATVESKFAHHALEVRLTFNI
ncbi:P44/Msp2 family outer membrane protein [Wolbachia endosymbiont of Ctenocephalides felis wCfeT]|uniref:P44/Msp2 family outer membrane protein n=1 Tax=Wolbachia endosymbiont of Ctenocephalides felis wCfeT TaxID=2732593 RepID=UPI001445CD43|nr:P44/Msp2 family outer membrane protein [Wolbachia endosymbiont of Ctenocephalides felis wCfeT]